MTNLYGTQCMTSSQSNSLTPPEVLIAISPPLVYCAFGTKCSIGIQYSQSIVISESIVLSICHSLSWNFRMHSMFWSQCLLVPKCSPSINVCHCTIHCSLHKMHDIHHVHHLWWLGMNSANGPNVFHFIHYLWYSLFTIPNTSDIDECEVSPCLNGATCYMFIAGFACVCPPGWTGRLCEEPMGNKDGAIYFIIYIIIHAHATKMVCSSFVSSFIYIYYLHTHILVYIQIKYITSINLV